MSIYRGAGGAGDATADSASEALLVQQLAAEVQVDADAAQASATAASGSASSASTSASNASTSASNAATSATNAANSATTAASYTPSQTGNSGKFLTTDGTNTSWGTVTGGVTSVTGTSPVVSSGGTTPAISMPAASTSVNGYLTSTDWNTFNGKQASGSYVTVGGALGTPSSGTLTNCTFPTLNQNTTGTASNVTGTVAIANGGTGQTSSSAAFNALSPITTTGDLIIGNGSSSSTRLAIGANTYVLTSNGTTATWAAAGGGGGFPAGTAMLFAQTTAPTGWTKSTTHDNKALRVVNGTASSGGTVAFTTAFASQAVSGTVGTSGATTLSTSQIPAHSHNITTYDYYGSATNNTVYRAGGDNTLGTATTQNAGGGGSHTHSGGTFTGTAINLAVQYVDVIIATKD